MLTPIEWNEIASDIGSYYDCGDLFHEEFDKLGCHDAEQRARIEELEAAIGEHRKFVALVTELVCANSVMLESLEEQIEHKKAEDERQSDGWPTIMFHVSCDEVFRIQKAVEAIEKGA